MEIYNKKELQERVKNYIENAIFIDFKRFIENIITLIRLFKKEQIDLFTVNADTTGFQKTMASVASKINLHSLVIQHGATHYFYEKPEILLILMYWLVLLK